VKIEIAELAQRIGLTKEQLQNPRVIAILEEHLAKLKAAEDAAPMLPHRPGAVTGGWRYLDYRNSVSNRPIQAKEVK
jgi:hypothetical protein